MESDSTQQASLAILANKIKRLKDKLISYGWSRQETYPFILYEFLKLPQVNWRNLETSQSFYQIKQKYKVQTEAAELILCMREIVPNLQSSEVLQYLHTVFDYSSIEFGISVFDSSSDSGENPHIIRRRPRGDKSSRKRSKSIKDSSQRVKKVHKEQQWDQKRQKESDIEQKEPLEKDKQKDLRLVRKRKRRPETDFEQLQKQVKKDLG